MSFTARRESREPAGGSRLRPSSARRSPFKVSVWLRRLRYSFRVRKPIKPNVPLFGEFLDDYLAAVVAPRSILAASTRKKYASLIESHLRPQFGHFPIETITTRLIEQFLAQKAESGLAWATRADLRNLLGAIFETAIRWDVLSGKNPARGARLGRRRPVREKRKLSERDLKRLLAALPEDVRRIAMVALFCGLRISEVLGLRWADIDFARGVLSVRQRYYRGDLDAPKSERGARDVPLGRLADELRAMGPGRGDEFVFSVRTARGVTRSDCDIRRYFLTPAAQKLGIHWKGFGWHALRREAITAIAAHSDAIQAMRLAGHSHMDMTMVYGMADLPRQRAAVLKFQRRLGLGKGAPR